MGWNRNPKGTGNAGDQVIGGRVGGGAVPSGQACTEITSINKYPVKKNHAISTKMIFALYGTWEALVWGKTHLQGVRWIFFYFVK